MKRIGLAASLFTLLFWNAAYARVARLRVERRERVLNGKSFGLAGPYEKLVGKVDFELDPALEQNKGIVDLALAPRNSRGEVAFSADFYLIKPLDPSRGNGRLFYEVGNRGGKAMLSVFQKAKPSRDPSAAEEFGDGHLMREGYSLLWMGWQWDVPDGQMRMDIPIASDHGKTITGLVRGNFVLNERSETASVADRNHKAYEPVDPASPENFMTVRNLPLDPPERISRERWHFVDAKTVTLDGGFEPGRIYDVVYRAKDPRVVGTGLSGTRDLISFLKYSQTEGNPLRGIQYAYAWGVSQSGRYIRHFLYQGFNEDEQGRQVFDGMIDDVGGAGRGSFNHRFGQASRDANEHFNFFFPVDMFPFTDGPSTDPETNKTDALLARAEARHVAPKVFHILSNSEYFNRAGSLIHTDPEGKRDAEIPENVRIYFVASAPHFAGAFPPPANAEPMGQTPLNPLRRDPVERALLEAMDVWVSDGVAPPASRYPRIADGTLTAPKKAGWPEIPKLPLPPPMLITYHLDFGPEWSSGVVSFEPPHIGKPYVGLNPAVDQDGNNRAGIRLPEIQAPLATYAGWNYRTQAMGLPDQLSGEAGSFYPFARTREERMAKGDPRLSIAERYSSKEQYLGKITEAGRQLVAERLYLAQDLPDLIDRAVIYYGWFTTP